MPLLAPLPTPYIPSLGTSGVSGYLIPPSLPKPLAIGGALAGGLSAALLATDLVGKAGGYKWRDDLLAKIGGGNISRPVPSNGLTGGQSVGVMYEIIVNGQVKFGSGSPLQGQNQQLFTNNVGLTLSGAITSAKVELRNGSADVYIVASNASGASERYLTGTNSSFAPLDISGLSVSIRRADGQPDTGGSPQTEKLPPIPIGYTPSNSPFNDNDRKAATPPPKPIQGTKSNGFLGALGLGGSVPTKSLSPSPVISPPNPNPNPNPSPNPPLTPTPTKPPLPSPSPDKDKDKDKKKTPPNTPENPPPDLGTRLRDLGAIIALIASNTSFDSLKNAAKTGSCESLKSPSCTKDMEDRIKNPISDKLDAAQTARDANAAAQTAALTGIAAEQQIQKGVLASILAKAREIFDLVGGLWNNGMIDKAMQYITMITVIHNAVMLTRGIGDTLGSALDSGLQALGLQIKDKDGNAQGVTAIIGKSFENLIKGIIGADNYTALTNTWLQANRVYQASINLLSNVQSILDSTTAVAELTSNRVATLMNSLRNAGVVRENAYGSQTPNTTRFNAFMNKLENLEQGTSNLASITGNIVSVQQSVNELKSNRTEFENAINNKNTVEETAKTEKREESVFKIADFTIVRPPEETP